MILRYSRQIMIPEFGFSAQMKLLKASVSVIGAGGIGTPVSTYLASAGIGKLKVIDPDRIEESNLCRQFMYTIEDIGKAKVECIKRRLESLNKDVKITAIQARVEADNIEDLLYGSDVIVEAVDNFATRFLLNAWSVRNKIPLVHGSIQGTQGQVCVVIPNKTPCLECLFSGAPSRQRPEAPVLGASAGVIGSAVANEVIKIITGYGKPLLNKMLVFDGWDLSFDIIKVNRRKECKICKN